MKPFKKVVYYSVLLLFVQTAQGCAGKQNKNESPAASTVIAKDSITVSTTAARGDEEQFRSFLAKFKSAVQAKNKVKLTSLFHFPLQTAPQWTNDELKNSTVTSHEGLINAKEFLTYFDDIFTRDAIKLIPASKEDDLSEIDKTTPENYYRTLQQVTDKGSALYELQKQYTQDNGEETSFGFVFGKIGGTYKIISFYRPWPLK